MSAFKIILNPSGNAGAIFDVDENETCYLEVKFDYLFEFDCQELLNVVGGDPCSGITQALETLDVCWTLDKAIVGVNGNEVENLYEEQLFKIDNLYNHINGNNATGLFFANSGSTVCSNVRQTIKSELGSPACEAVSASTFSSCWLTKTALITDASILSAMTNEEIKISLKVKDCCVDFGLLIDRVELNKKCTKIEKEDIFITKTPSFELERTCDNKKSWVANDDGEDRTFDLTLRNTEYTADHHKSVINSKEIDLNISPASAIETDVECYIKDNSCILDCLTATTYTCPSGYDSNVTNTECVKTSITGATFNGSGATITGGDTSVSYGAFGSQFFPDQTNQTQFPLIRTSNINSLENQTGETITPTTIITTGNTFWGSTNGRLNNVGISATTEWRGFSHCLQITEGDTYYIGLASDNFSRFSIDGTLLVNLSTAYNKNFNNWHVIPYYLEAGQHIIEMEGRNAGGIAAFGAEIYNPTSFATLTAATNTTEAGVIFSTFDKIGDFYDLGDTVGYTCPTGYGLDTCLPAPYQCVLIESAEISSINICPPRTISCPTLDVSGCTTGTCISTCGDIGSIDYNDLLTIGLSAATTLKEFEHLISSQLIDVKTRKTLSGYPVLRTLYDRYVNSTDYCGPQSAAFDYSQMQDFTDLIGTYWVDLIEQVIPSTTIWGSTYVYKNTIFDAQKVKYRKGNTHFCDVPATGCSMDDQWMAYDNNVQVNQTTLGFTDPTIEEQITTLEGEIAENEATLATLDFELQWQERSALNQQIKLQSLALGQLQESVVPCEDIVDSGDTCNGIYILERQFGSEFRGTVTVDGPDANEILGITVNGRQSNTRQKSLLAP